MENGRLGLADETAGHEQTGRVTLPMVEKYVGGL
jgi:hypothetical protein